jgi:hypothetical protein
LRIKVALQAEIVLIVGAVRDRSQRLYALERARIEPGSRERVRTALVPRMGKVAVQVDF